jgi:hypothetical protein
MPEATVSSRTLYAVTTPMSSELQIPHEASHITLSCILLLSCLKIILAGKFAGAHPAPVSTARLLTEEIWNFCSLNLATLQYLYINCHPLRRR